MITILPLSSREAVLRSIHSVQGGEGRRGPWLRGGVDILSLMDEKSFAWTQAFAYRALSEPNTGLLEINLFRGCVHVRVGLWSKWMGTAIFHSRMKYSYGIVGVETYQAERDIGHQVLGDPAQAARHAFSFCDKVRYADNLWRFHGDDVREYLPDDEDKFWESQLSREDL